MSESKIYQLFGMTVQSEIPLLAPTGYAPPEVCIRVGVCPELTDEILYESDAVQLARRQLRFSIPNVATYYVSSGREIVVSLPPNPDLTRVQSFLLGSAMGALLLQRGVMPMHGSCVCRNGSALMIIGASGVGKSTLANEFISRGWKLMSDDVTPVAEKNGIFYAQSSYPGQKMWLDTVTRGRAENRIIGEVVRSDQRLKYQLNAAEAFVTAKMPIRHVLLLTANASSLRFDEFIGFSKTAVLMDNRYRSALVVDQRDQADHLKKCIGLGQQVRLFGAARPREMEAASQIADRIEKEMEIDT